MPWVTERHGKNFSQHAELFAALKTISTKPNLSQLDYVYLDLVAKLLITYSSKFTDPAAIRQLISGAAKNYLNSVDVASVSTVFGFFTHLIELHIFDIWCISSVGDIVNFILEHNSYVSILKPIVKFFASYCIQRKPFLEEVTGLLPTSEAFPNFLFLESRKLFFDVSSLAKLRDIVTEKAMGASDLKDEISVHSLVVYPWLWRLTEKPDGVAELEAGLETLLDGEKQDATSLLITYLITYNLTLLRLPTMTAIPIDRILKFARNQNATDEVTLRIIYLLLANSAGLEAVNHLEYLEKFAEALQSCFVSPSGIIRRLALKILIKFDEHLEHGFMNEEEEKFVPSESAFSILLEIEETPSTMQSYRRRAALIRKVNYKLFDRMLPKDASKILQQVS